VKRILLPLTLVLGSVLAVAALGGWKLTRSHANPLRCTDLEEGLLTAIRDGDRDRVVHLLEQGTDVNARDENGTTPLMQAALNADAGLLEILLERGADPRATDPHEATALLRAVHDPAKVRLLLRHAAPIRDDELVLAALVPGNAESVQLLLQQGGNANAEVHGFTALMAAATAGDLANVASLLDHGAEVRRQREDGYTAVYGGALSGNAAVVKLLLNCGADPNVVHVITNPTYDLQTPLTLAAWLGDGAVVRELLARGADVHVHGGSFERTALLGAATNGKAEVVRLLLERGADVHAQDWAGHTPLFWARRRGDLAVIQLLEKAGAGDPAGNARVPGAESAKPQSVSRGTAGASEDSSPSHPGSPGHAPSVQRVVAAALPLLQRSGATFTQRKGCVSCHHQAAVALAVSQARAHGFAVNQQTADQERAHVLAYLDMSREKILRGNGIDPALVGWTLWSLSAEGQNPCPLTDALVHFLVLHQKQEGYWRTPVYRPPHDASHLTYTALAVRGLQRYVPPGRSQEIQARIARGREWLLHAEATETEDQAFRLLGLRWTEAGSRDVQAAAAHLLHEQRADGGWAQLPTLPSDAYATGEVLYALHEAGLSARDPALQRGVEFLLRTQRPDGSWFVPTRSFPLIELFSSGFPHGRAQFISAAATCWATMALTRTEPGSNDYPTATVPLPGASGVLP
jgi:ankyrin repeat protein